MLKQKSKTKKSLALASETLRTLQAQDLRLVAGGYTNESNANDLTCHVCQTDICEF
jgi:hypothetical protein